MFVIRLVVGKVWCMACGLGIGGGGGSADELELVLFGSKSVPATAGVGWSCELLESRVPIVEFSILCMVWIVICFVFLVQ